MTVQVLERPMYAEPEAARPLQVAPSTLHYWLEGGERRGKQYLPVIRAETTSAKTVTWGEFVEAALLRQYRRAHFVPMVELRAAIEILHHDLGVPYPLAHSRPFVGAGRKLLLKAQTEAEVPGEYCLVAVAGGQQTLTPASEAFYDRVDWEGDLASGWRPAEDSKSPVRIRPDQRFGLPAIGGIKTETVWEHLEAGEDPRDVATELDLTVEEVRWALAYETSARARAS
jgi:uncharacterized protein (DUF433 family)